MVVEGDVACDVWDVCVVAGGGCVTVVGVVVAIGVSEGGVGVVAVVVSTFGVVVGVVAGGGGGGAEGVVTTGVVVAL